MLESRLRENLSKVEGRIGEALERCGRAASVEMVAVTKSHPVAAVRAALAVGMTRCGENRVLELEEKVGTIGRAAAEWHLIGHLQRNKIKLALPLFDLVHSIDSARLARELSKEAKASGVTVNGLIQVNVSGEDTKGGFEAGDAGAALEEIASVCDLPGLRVAGLMTMAPYTDDLPVLRATFGRARSLFEKCGSDIRGFDARHLSMGMSNDFEIAIEEGSTMVRLGTILFGEREQ